MDTMMKINMQKAETRPYDPGIHLNGRKEWEQVNELDRLINLFTSKLEDCWDDYIRIMNNEKAYYEDLEEKKKIILDKNALRNKGQKIGNKLCTLLWQFQIKLEEVQYTDYCKWLDVPIIIKHLYLNLDLAVASLRLFNIEFIPLKFSSQVMIQWQEPKDLPLDMALPVSVLQVNYATTVESISEVCQCIVTKGNTNRRVSKVLTVKYATQITHRSELLEEPQTLPLGKDKTVTIFTLHFGKLGVMQDWDNCQQLELQKPKEVVVLDCEEGELLWDYQEDLSGIIDTLPYGCGNWNEPHMLNLQEVWEEVSDYLGEEMLDYGETSSKIYDRGKSYTKNYSTEKYWRKGTKLMILNDLVIVWLQRYFTRKMTPKIVFDRGKIIV